MAAGGVGAFEPQMGHMPHRGQMWSVEDIRRYFKSGDEYSRVDWEERELPETISGDKKRTHPHALMAGELQYGLSSRSRSEHQPNEPCRRTTSSRATLPTYNVEQGVDDLADGVKMGDDGDDVTSSRSSPPDRQRRPPSSPTSRERIVRSTAFERY
ncbi:hypothetical protein B0H16DRAFT_1452163 [Mycena metata]|uniref:Uncharacterized protein n=1 Tax=Mycena metata TaxID=1033252 RepID=A0AAD7NQE9_9AGAR|nr:hypothetical protein B0H16DRAFT_1452163 [Mycena metata]